MISNQARLAASIDRDLQDRALHSPPPPGQPPNEGQPPGSEPGDPNDAPAPPRRQAMNQRYNDPESVRFADVRRPRRFDPQNRSLGPAGDQPFDPVAIASALHGHSSFSNGIFDGQTIRIYTMPIPQGPNRGGAVQVARETRDLDEMRSAQLWTLLIFLPCAILCAGIGAFFLTRQATKPIGEMKSAANAITEQDLSQRLTVHGQDEFAELGATFNAMIDRLQQAFSSQKEAYASLEQAHETQKRFTADASHELRTPLTRLRLATSSALADGATAEEKQKALQVADAASQTMGRLVQEMLVLARADAGQLTMQSERIDLRVVASDVLRTFPSVHVDIQDSAVMIYGDAGHLSRVLTNLVENALRHTPPPGEVKVTVCSDSKSATIRVQDTGEGIAAEHLPHVTERFYRADAARARADGGVGLGLAICKTIIESHSGTLRIESEVDRGTVVTIQLPLNLS